MRRRKAPQSIFGLFYFIYSEFSFTDIFLVPDIPWFLRSILRFLSSSSNWQAFSSVPFFQQHGMPRTCPQMESEAPWSFWLVPFQAILGSTEGSGSDPGLDHSSAQPSTAGYCRHTRRANIHAGKIQSDTVPKTQIIISFPKTDW